MSGKAKLKVIYIGGLEHSGSTLLGLILDNHPEAVCAGEISHIPRVGWSGEEICSCGEKISDCSFWGQIKHCWKDKTGATIQSLVDLEFSIDSNRNLPRVLLEKYRRSSTFDLYSKLTSAMFASIAQVSGASTIVDTSKRASRAYAISLIDNVDFRLIHLVRDPRGVAFSSEKPARKKRRKWYSSAIRWSLINRAFDHVRKSVGDDRALLVRYEDLISNPTEVLSRIGEFVELEMSELAAFSAQGGALKARHIGGGNRFVHTADSFNLRSDLNWTTKMAEQKQRWIKRMTLGGMHHYGY